MATLLERFLARAVILTDPNQNVLGSDDNPLKTSGANGVGNLGPPITGQVKIAVTGTPVQLPANALQNGVIVKASAFNQPQSPTYSGTVGPSNAIANKNDGTGVGYTLAPGEAISFACANTNQVWVNGVAGDVFVFAGG